LKTTLRCKILRREAFKEMNRLMNVLTMSGNGTVRLFHKLHINSMEACYRCEQVINTGCGKEKGSQTPLLLGVLTTMKGNSFKTISLL